MGIKRLLLTFADLERDYALKREQVYKLMMCGELPFLRIGRAVRFEPDALEAFLDSCRRRVPPMSNVIEGQGRDFTDTQRLHNRAGEHLDILALVVVEPLQVVGPGGGVDDRKGRLPTLNKFGDGVFGGGKVGLDVQVRRTPRHADGSRLAANAK